MFGFLLGYYCASFFEEFDFQPRIYFPLLFVSVLFPMNNGLECLRLQAHLGYVRYNFQIAAITKETWNRRKTNLKNIYLNTALRLLFCIPNVSHFYDL